MVRLARNFSFLGGDNIFRIEKTEVVNGCDCWGRPEYDEVDFKTDYWGDGAWCDCPECGKEVELDDYEYD